MELNILKIQLVSASSCLHRNTQPEPVAGVSVVSHHDVASRCGGRSGGWTEEVVHVPWRLQRWSPAAAGLPVPHHGAQRGPVECGQRNQPVRRREESLSRPPWANSSKLCVPILPPLRFVYMLGKDTWVERWPWPAECAKTPSTQAKCQSLDDTAAELSVNACRL